MNLIFGWLILNRLSLLIENGSRRHSDIVAFNQFQSIVAFNVKTSHQICSASQTNGLNMKYNIGRKMG